MFSEVGIEGVVRFFDLVYQGKEYVEVELYDYIDAWERWSFSTKKRSLYGVWKIERWYHFIENSPEVVEIIVKKEDMLNKFAKIMYKMFSREYLFEAIGVIVDRLDECDSDNDDRARESIAIEITTGTIYEVSSGYSLNLCRS